MPCRKTKVVRSSAHDMLPRQIAQGYQVCYQTLQSLQTGALASRCITWQILRWPLSATMCMECFVVLHMNCLYSAPDFSSADVG